MPVYETRGLCKNCKFGCNRLEDINFKGIYRCEYYIGGDTNEFKQNDKERT